LTAETHTHIRTHTHTHTHTHIHKGGKDVCTRTQGKKERERERDRRKDQFAFHVLRRGRDPGYQNEGWNLPKKKQRRRHDPKMCSKTSAADTIQNLRRNDKNCTYGHTHIHKGDKDACTRTQGKKDRQRGHLQCAAARSDDDWGISPSCFCLTKTSFASFHGIDPF
jgi:hypothetical protein